MPKIIEYNGETYDLSDLYDIKRYISSMGLSSNNLSLICHVIDDMSDALQQIGDLTLVPGNWQPHEPIAHRGMISWIKSHQDSEE